MVRGARYVDFPDRRLLAETGIILEYRRHRKNSTKGMGSGMGEILTMLLGSGLYSKVKISSRSTVLLLTRRILRCVFLFDPFKHGNFAGDVNLGGGKVVLESPFQSTSVIMQIGEYPFGIVDAHELARDGVGGTTFS